MKGNLKNGKLKNVRDWEWTEPGMREALRNGVEIKEKVDCNDKEKVQERKMENAGKKKEEMW